MKACSRAGVFVFTNVEYHSNIHGRHIFFRIRTADEPVTSHVERVDVLLALDAETIYGTDPHQDYQSHKGHLHEVVPGGAIVVDAKAGITAENLGRDDVRLLSLPYDDIVRSAVEEHGIEYNARRHAVMANMVPIGRVLRAARLRGGPRAPDCGGAPAGTASEPGADEPLGPPARLAGRARRPGRREVLPDAPPLRRPAGPDARRGDTRPSASPSCTPAAPSRPTTRSPRPPTRASIWKRCRRTGRSWCCRRKTRSHP